MDKFVSVITVNYNGKRFLEDFLNSALVLNYPKNKYEVIVVDNASVDGSVSYVKHYFPKVRTIESPKNIGFGAGNNLGIKSAKGELFFLVNNDTALDKNVLKEAVLCFNNWSQKKSIGAINTKLVLFDSYLPFVLKGATFSKYQVPEYFLPKNKKPYIINHGRDKEPWEEIYLPINYFPDDDVKLAVFIRKTEGKKFQLCLDSLVATEEHFRDREDSKEIKLNLNREQLRKSKLDLIQNAGSILFRDGFGRDRGAEIINYDQYFEPDKGQYNKEEIISMFCGAGVLLNKKALEDVGFFDERFFMYYEDSDLSLRLKEAGWGLIYCPKAIIRHIHAGSSEEWSSFFIFHVERNRLLFVAKYWPRLFAIKEWFKYFFQDTLVVFIYYLTRGQEKKSYTRLKVRLKVNFLLMLPFFICLLHKKRLSYNQVQQLL